jgi:Bax protein
VSSKTPIPDFAAMVHIPTKKQRFFDYLHERTRKSNDTIWAERQFVLNFREQYENGGVSPSHQVNFSKLVDRYDLEIPEKMDDAFFTSLLERVDVVPASLVLAQGANESGWGTSRFAQEGRNFFGIWCYKEGCGLKPASRNNGSTHEVRKFDTVQQNVSFYMLNINIGHAYEDLRKMRAELRANEEKLSGVRLAEGLIRYSERGNAYVEEIQSMINKTISRHITSIAQNLSPTTSQRHPFQLYVLWVAVKSLLPINNFL